MAFLSISLSTIINKEKTMKQELLPPDTLTDHLRTRQIELLNALNSKLKAQKNLPQGHLRIEQKRGVRAPQFYHFTNPAEKVRIKILSVLRECYILLQDAARQYPGSRLSALLHVQRV